MDWIIFGDDWGKHPSTTQHLAKHFPPTDRIIWVESLGMRAPRLTQSDLKRIMDKASGMLELGQRAGRTTEGKIPPHISVIKPRVLPWHSSPAVASLNRQLLAAQLDQEVSRRGMRDVRIITANPIAYHYIDPLKTSRVGYLKLDDYLRLPGVDAHMVAPIEHKITRQADVVFATAKNLLPDEHACQRRVYLPQGVDVSHFEPVSKLTSDEKVLGFFGLIAEWMDFDLIASVARARPDWTVELLGPVRSMPDGLLDAPNITWRPGVSYEQLPEAICHWRAAWIPFLVNDLTLAVNPLKLREYLAAGLPTACTPLPEASNPSVTFIRDAEDVSSWLDAEASADSQSARSARHDAVLDDSWTKRAEALREAMA